MIALLCLLGSHAARADVAEGLIGYWPFDGNGSDESGGGRPLTVNGNAGFAPGLFGQSLDLHYDPNSYAAREIDDEVFNFGDSDFTVQVWVNYNRVDLEQTLIEKFQGSAGAGWSLTSLLGGGDEFGQAHFYASSGAIGLYSRPLIDILPNVWHNVTVLRSGSSFNLLFDGNVVDSRTSDGLSIGSSMPLLIGRRNSADGRNFSLDGRLDDVAIWNRALSSAELDFLYNQGQGNAVAGMLSDLNGDHDVDSDDLANFLENWTGSDYLPKDKTRQQGDGDGDGDVDSADTVVFLSNWTGAQAAGSNLAAVPEPSCLALLVPAGLLLLQPQRRSARRQFGFCSGYRCLGRRGAR